MNVEPGDGSGSIEKIYNIILCCANTTYFVVRIYWEHKKRFEFEEQLLDMLLHNDYAVFRNQNDWRNHSEQMADSLPAGS